MILLIRILLDLTTNIFNFLFLKQIIDKGLKFPFELADYSLLFFYICFSIPEHVPYKLFVFGICDFIYIFIKVHKQISVAIKSFFIFESLETICFNALLLFHTFIFNDYNLYAGNYTYAYCKDKICISAVFIVYSLYLNAKKSFELNKKLSIVFSLLISIVYVLISYLTLYVAKNVKTNPQIFCLNISILFIVIILCIILYDRFIQLTKEKINLTNQATRVEILKEYSSQVESSLKEVHSIRHDMKNNLIIIHKYAQENRTDKISTLVDDVLEKLNNSNIIDTGIPIVSAILNTKSAEAQSHNINFEYTATIPFLSISDSDIVIILGNLLDNAITAAAKCEDGYIKIFLEQQNDLLLLKCENNYSGEIKKKGELFISSKENDGLKHGIGIENVKKAILKLGGTSFFSYDNKVFTVDVTLPNYL